VALHRQLVELGHRTLATLHPQGRLQGVVELDEVRNEGNVVLMEVGFDLQPGPPENEEGQQLERHVRNRLGVVLRDEDLARQIGALPVLGGEAEGVFRAHPIWRSAR